MVSMLKLHEDDYERVRPLMGDLVNYNVSIDGVLEGYNPGEVYVDDLQKPQVMLLISPEAAYLNGEVLSAAHVDALRVLVADLMQNQGLDALWLDCGSVWENLLADMLPWPPIHHARQHYVCTELALDWRAHVPEGFTVLPLTQELLNDSGLDIPDHIHGWIQNNWETTDNFLAQGFGFATKDQAQNQVVSWSLCDCIGGGACEIGIRTHPDYRRRGLAAITSAAAVDHALANGLRWVGWHCDAENIGSQRTALKVGFAWEREYTHHVCFRSEATHWAEMGRWQALHGNYRAAADLYVRADAAEDQPDWGQYIPFYAACMFAQLGEYPAAWNWLHRAVARGFDDLDSLQTSEALTPLKVTEDWKALLHTIMLMQANEDDS